MSGIETTAAIAGAKGFIYSVGTALVLFLTKSINTPWRVSVYAGVASAVSGLLLGNTAAEIILSVFNWITVDTAVQLGHVVSAASGPSIIVGLYKLSKKVIDILNEKIVEKIEKKIDGWKNRNGE